MLCGGGAIQHQHMEDKWRQRARELRAPVVEGSLFGMLGQAGKVFACLSVIMVMVTVVSLCISTMSDHQQEEATVCMSQRNAVHGLESSQNTEHYQPNHL